MSLTLKKLILGITFNTCLFFILMIGIQNSSSRSKVTFLIYETINFPISSIIGTNFICGSLIGTFLTINLIKKD